MDFEKIKIGLWGAALGAFALFGVGFGMSGWVLAGTDHQNAENAVVDRLTPICMAQFQHDPMKAQKVVALKALDYDKRAAFVAKQGWATMPGDSTPDNEVATKCSDRITG